MMPATYEPIATTTLGSAAANIVFNSIPGTYTDLRIILVGTTSVAAPILCRVNSDTGTNYSRTILWGDGTSASSTRYTSNAFFNITLQEDFSTTIPEMVTLDFMSYAGSTFKTMLNTVSADKNGSGSVRRGVQLWRSTSAITAIELYPNATNFATGTVATLYGIKAA